MQYTYNTAIICKINNKVGYGGHDSNTKFLKKMFLLPDCMLFCNFEP